MQYRIYRLPPGNGFYVVTGNKQAFLFDEKCDFNESAMSVAKSPENFVDKWSEFISDFDNFGINGFGFNGSSVVI